MTRSDPTILVNHLSSSTLSSALSIHLLLPSPILGQIDLIIPIETGLALALNGPLDLDQHRRLPWIQFGNPIVLIARRGKSLRIVVLHALNQLPGELAFPRIGEGVVQILILLNGLGGTDGISVGQVAHGALEEVSLGVEFEEVGLQAVPAELVVNLSRAEEVGRVEGGGAQFGHLGLALRLLGAGLFGAKELRGLLVIVDGEADILIFAVLKNFGNLLGQFGGHRQTAGIA
mmetsp:Transcript_469/g.816  ORF Transcript_469/g.816 Transcript_469/m.816 type:complete len:232 (+) Transcript_469:182-877(+)